MVFLQNMAISSTCYQVKDDVLLKVEKLDSTDCKKLFHGKTTVKGKNPIYPIKLSFTNHSNKSWALNSNGIGLNLASHREVLNSSK